MTHSTLRVVMAAFSAAIMLSLPTACNAQSGGFTGAQFLSWKRDSQDSLIETSITMTAIIATQGHQDIASCIDDWYTGNEAIHRLRHEFILRTIRENPNYHPQGVILAIIQKQCGSFKSSAG